MVYFMPFHTIPFDWIDWEDDVIRNLSKLPNVAAKAGKSM